MTQPEIVDAQVVRKQPKSALEIVMWLVLGLCGVAFLSCTGCLFLLTTPGHIADIEETSEASGLLSEVTEPKENPRKDLIASQFSVWDGSHRELVKLVKTAMNDPDSFEHVETNYWDQGETILIKMQFRGKNGFGGVVTQTATGMATIEGSTELVMVQ